MKKVISLDSVLLLALVTPFIMGFRIGPGETPYLLFGLIFLLLFSYIIVDLIPLQRILYERVKQFLLWIVIVVVIGSAFVSAIIVRHQTAPVYMVHDIILQQEAAIRYLLDGKNPYAETYFGTPLEEWHYSEHETNPALYHFVMGPFYLLFALPFYFVSNIFFGFFDGRIPLLFLFLSLLALASFMVKDIKNRLLFLVLLAFHPSLLPYSLEGRSDIFMFAFLFAGFFLLQKSKYNLSGVAIALACLVKQSAWPLIPFYFVYLYWQKKSFSKAFPPIASFIGVFLLITLPFFFWNQKAFLDSTVFYLSGNTEHSYPISGYGIGSILLQLHIIQDKLAYYPFIFWQIFICLPLLLILLWYLKNNRGVKTLILVYALFLFVYWYFSRYFNNSHIAYISLLFITAYFWPSEHREGEK